MGRYIPLRSDLFKTNFQILLHILKQMKMKRMLSFPYLFNPAPQFLYLDLTFIHKVVHLGLEFFHFTTLWAIIALFLFFQLLQSFHLFFQSPKIKNLQHHLATLSNSLTSIWSLGINIFRAKYYSWKQNSVHTPC